MNPNHTPDPRHDLVAALERTDFSDESRIRRSLRSTLIARLDPEESHSREKIPMRGSRLLIRLMLIPAALLLAAALVILAVPSARAAAAEFIAKFGSLLISSKPTGAEQIVASPRSDVDLGGVSAPTPNYTNWSYIMPLDEAEKVLGAPLLEPGYVPDGYALTLRFRTTNIAGGAGISATYNAGDSTHALIVEQYRFSGDIPREIGLGSTPVTHLTVRGNDALWAEQVPLGWINRALTVNPQTGNVEIATEALGEGTPQAEGTPGPSGPQPEIWKLNLLMWEENGSVFRVMSDTLPQDELVRVAESLALSSTGAPAPASEMPAEITTEPATQAPSETPTAETTQTVTEVPTVMPTSDTGSIPPTGDIEPSPAP